MLGLDYGSNVGGGLKERAALEPASPMQTTSQMLYVKTNSFCMCACFNGPNPKP